MSFQAEEQTLIVSFDAAISGLNSFQLLQTVTGDGKGQEEEVSSSEEHGAIVRKLTASQSKKHLALLANELADKSFNQWSSSSSESSCSMEDVKQHMMNGTHSDLKGCVHLYLHQDKY